MPPSSIRTTVKAFSVLILSFVVLAASGHRPLQGQSKGKPAPPQVVCNSNLNCEYEELNTGKTLAEQPCADCRPTVYGPLQLNFTVPLLQIASTEKSVPTSRDSESAATPIVLCQYTGNAFPGTGGFAAVWKSEPFKRGGQTIRIGDADGDGVRELVALRANRTVTGKGSSQTVSYQHDLMVFEDGSTGDAAFEPALPNEQTGAYARGLFIADIDGNAANGNELLIFKSGTDASRIEVYRLTETEQGYTIVRLNPGCMNFDFGIWGLDVADVDLDGDNEVLLARFSTLRPGIFKFNATGGTWSETVPESVIDPVDPAECFPGTSIVYLNVIRARDLDGDGRPEIVTGGNSGFLIVWKFMEGHYHKFPGLNVSPDITGDFTWALDIGNVDGDSAVEIVVGLGAGGGIPDAIRVIKYYVGELTPVTLQPQAPGAGIGLDDIRVGDLDGEAPAEIIAPTLGLSVFRLTGDPALPALSKIFNYALGNSVEVR